MVKCVCENCGKEFNRRPSLLKEHIFCSVKCRAEKWNNKVKIICKVCGKEFSWRASRLKYYPTEYCSKKCAGFVRRKRVNCICKNCGKEFEIKESATKRKYPRGAYCSFECYHEYSKGKNSHMYDHGQTFYPYCELFNETLKERVRYFFGNKCVISGVTKEENYNKKLDVHHVYVEKLACCESKMNLADMDLVRKRFPPGIAKFGVPFFDPWEIVLIRMMVPLSLKEHSRLHKMESSDLPYEKTYYRKMFTEMILSVGGKCYLSLEEFKEIKGGSSPSG